MNDDELLTPMTAAVREVGALLATLPEPGTPAPTLARFRAVFDGYDEPTTKLIRDRLTELRPGAGWADELGEAIPATGEVWVVDTVDGAVQFLQGLPHWSISATLVREGAPVAAVLHAPSRGETYTAAKGFGAFRNGRPIRPSAKTELRVSLVATSQPPLVAAQPDAIERAGRALAAVLPVIGAVRNLGPTSWQIADTAAGRIDAFWEFGSDDANLAGAALVATEARAVVTDLAGRPWRPGARSLLAAPAQLHGPLREILDL
jgi:myo-inositol-1(or 4)-monophosphatase